MHLNETISIYIRIGHDNNGAMHRSSRKKESGTAIALKNTTIAGFRFRNDVAVLRNRGDNDSTNVETVLIL